MVGGSSATSTRNIVTYSWVKRIVATSIVSMAMLQLTIRAATCGA